MKILDTVYPGERGYWPPNYAANPTVVNLPVVSNNGMANNAVPIYEYNPNFAAGTAGPITLFF